MKPEGLVRIAALLAAIPALVLLLVGLAVEGIDAREARNAGQVIGGMVRRDGIGVVMDRVVNKRFRVWVVGNSNANTDIDPDVLATQLGVPPAEVAVLSIPNANAAHWVAMLRRLRGVADPPELVLVVSRLQLVLIDVPISEGARRSLEELAGPDDADLRELANPAGQGVAEILRRREGVRDQVGETLRTLLPSLLGIARAETTLRRALSDDRVDVDRLGPPPPRPLPAPEDSLVPELGALAEELGIRLVVARPPASPLTTAEQADLVPDGYPERTRALLAEHGVGFVDLSALPMRRHHYKNVDHLAEEGARRLTATLMGYLEPPRNTGIDALGAPRFEDGALVVHRGVLTYHNLPPDLTDVPATSTAGTRDGVRWVKAPRGVPSDIWTMTNGPGQPRCSPIRVRVPSGILDAGWPCKRLQEGTLCHGPDRIGFIPRDLRLADDQWEMILDPGRRCDGAAWLYPEDRLSIRWPDVALPGGSPTHVVLEASLPRPQTQVRVVVRDGRDVIARGRLGGQRPLVLPLLGVVAPTVWVQSDGFVLLTRAELVRR